MAIALQKLNEKTVEDFLAYDDDDRVELIHGEIYLMAPPLDVHANATGQVCITVGSYEKAKYDPNDPEGFWIFPEITTYYDQKNVFVHDLAAFWKKDLPALTAQRLTKARPFWVCEVLSPSNQKNDLERKRVILEHYQVPFYWIISPESRSITVLHLKHPGESYNIAAIASVPEDGKIKLPPFDEVELELARIFPQPISS